MTFPANKKTKLSALGIVLLLAIAIPGTTLLSYAYAETSSILQNNFTVLQGDDLKNNPLAQIMLERIEIMKQRIAEMQNKQNEMTEQQKFIEEQRKLVKERLAEDLDRMDKKYKDQTPEAAFSSFVSKTPEKVHDVFWGMYDYQRMKVKAAQSAMKQVLDNGSSLQEVRDAYNSNAASKRTELIEVTKNLNIQYGLADSTVQLTFDRYGKLPRTG